MSEQTVASIKASDGPRNYCLGILSSLSLSDEDKLSFLIGNCLITFNKHVVYFLSPWIFDIIKDEYCCLKDHVFISLPEETSVRGFLSLKAVIETGVTHELSNLDKDQLYDAIKLLGMDIQLKKIVTVNECTLDGVDCDVQEHESIISTEDMFTRSVEMVSADDTNNNKTLEPRTSNGVEENMDLNKDLEVLEEFNKVNSMENAQRNKPVVKKCEVRINRINRKSFGIMRNCCVKIKRLDRKVDNSLKWNLKQPLPYSLATTGNVDKCLPQSSPSATPAQSDKEETRKINFSIKESDKSDSLNTSRAIEKDNADKSMVPTPIDRNNVQERGHSTVILYSANCDEFFSSLGRAHTTDDENATSNHAHSTGDGKDTPSHTHSNQLTQIKVPNRSNPTQEYDGPVEEEICMEVDNGDFEKNQNTHDRSLRAMLPSNLDAKETSVPTPSLLGYFKSSKTNNEEDVEKQIELVPKIKIKRNLIQWAFEFDSLTDSNGPHDNHGHSFQ